MGNINTTPLTKALTYGICAYGLFILAIWAVVVASPFISDLHASMHRKGVMKAERMQNPCVGCHRIYHRATYAALGEQKFFNAYPAFKPETPWRTRKSFSEKTPEAQWRVYHDRWPVPGSIGAHDDALEVYIFEDGQVLVFTHYARTKQKIATL